MKKAKNKVLKLTGFLARTLIKVVTTGKKVLEEIKKTIDKGSKLGPLLLEITTLLGKLNEIAEKIEELEKE